jgi:hypothetical protein
MARVDPAPFHVIVRDPRKMEISVPSGRILICLLEFGYPFLFGQQDEKNLALRRMRNAHCHRRHDGTVSFSLVMIVLNVAAFGPGRFAEEKQLFYSLRQLLREVVSPFLLLDQVAPKS